MASEYVRLHIMKHALEHYIKREGASASRLSRRNCIRWRYLTQIAQILPHSCIKKTERYLLELISFWMKYPTINGKMNQKTN